MGFNPRLPCGKRPVLLAVLSAVTGGFNPRLPCGKRPGTRWACARSTTSFNPRLPCGKRPENLQQTVVDYEFQSAPPVREATFPASINSYWSSGFNPRLPCGKRPGSNQRSPTGSSFNPRLPCGKRPSSLLSFVLVWVFQSAPPVREATPAFYVLVKQCRIVLFARTVLRNTVSATFGWMMTPDCGAT